MSIAGAVFAVWLWTAGTALANGMPMAALTRPGGGAVRPDRPTTVAVEREDLAIDMREREVRVRAVYELRNRGEQPASLSVAFAVPVSRSVPQAALVSPVVTLDGRAVPTAVWEPPDGLGAETYVDRTWRDPYTGSAYQPGEVGERRGTYWFSFPITFGAGQARRLEVSYGQAVSTDYSRFVDRADRADYLLLPAKHWAGFGALSLEVLVPPGRTVFSDLALTRAGDGRYTAWLEGLPASNLSLFVAPTGGRGWAASLWQRRDTRPWLLVALALGASTAASLLLHARRAGLHRWGALLRWGTPVAVLLMTPVHLFEPNPIGLMKTMFLFMPGLLLACWLGGWATARWMTR